MEVIEANDAADLQAMAGAISFVDTLRSDAVKGPSMVAFDCSLVACRFAPDLIFGVALFGAFSGQTNQSYVLT